jgi:hypothetical protein
MTPEMTVNYVKPSEFPKTHGDIEDLALLLLKALEDNNHKNDAIICLLQDIRSIVNDLIPFPE